ISRPRTCLSPLLCHASVARLGGFAKPASSLNQRVWLRRSPIPAQRCRNIAVERAKLERFPSAYPTHRLFSGYPAESSGHHGVALLISPSLQIRDAPCPALGANGRALSTLDIRDVGIPSCAKYLLPLFSLAPLRLQFSSTGVLSRCHLRKLAMTAHPRTAAGTS